MIQHELLSKLWTWNVNKSLLMYMKIIYKKIILRFYSLSQVLLPWIFPDCYSMQGFLHLHLEHLEGVTLVHLAIIVMQWQ